MQGLHFCDATQQRVAADDIASRTSGDNESISTSGLGAMETRYSEMCALRAGDSPNDIDALVLFVVHGTSFVDICLP